MSDRKNVFVSYVEEDKKYKNKLKLWEKRQKYGDHMIRIHSRDDSQVRSRSGKIIRSRLIQKMTQADFVVVIVGNNNHRHPWLKYEGLARKLKITRYYMRIPYSTGALPKRFTGMKQIAYNPNALDKLFRETDKDGTSKPDVAEGGSNEEREIKSPPTPKKIVLLRTSIPERTIKEH